MYREEEKEQFMPTEKEREIVENSWIEFQELYQLKNEPLDILSGRTLQTFWDQSNQDYVVITEPHEENDPVVPYSSSISRDKADEFIGQLVAQLIYPSVTAQNTEQEEDRIMGKVSRALVEFLHDNDGFPSESGHQKMTRYVHKAVVEGTCHVMDTLSTEGLESELVPNEEVFIPNFWQTDIQKQGVVYRAKLNVTYDEVESVFGDFDNWKYVKPMRYDSFFVEHPEFKQFWEGILDEEYMQVLYKWQPLSKKELKEFKKKGKVKSWAKQARFFQVIINNVPMYPKDNILAYNDGYCPINKLIFAKHSKPEFYWGNSLPNKIREDKAWIDAWKTLIRYKAKLNLLKPMISRNGNFIDEEIIMPAKITPLPDDVELKVIDGVAEPLNQSDITVMQMAEGEIERGAKAPQTNIDPNATARAAVIQESNAKILLNSIALELIFFLSARTYPIIMRAFQFLPRNQIKKIAIPEQTLADGRVGTLEVIFENIPEMSVEEFLQKSIDIRSEEKAATKAGQPKNKVYVNPKYARELNYYVKFEAGISAFGKDELKVQKFNVNYDRYMARPDLYNPKKVARQFVQLNKDNEDLLTDEQIPTQPPLEQGQLKPQEQKPLEQVPGFPTL